MNAQGNSTGLALNVNLASKGAAKLSFQSNIKVNGLEILHTVPHHGSVENWIGNQLASVLKPVRDVMHEYYEYADGFWNFLYFAIFFAFKH